LISSVTAKQHSTTASIGGNVAQMQQEVQTIEARNEARRSMTPAAEAPDGRLTQAWNRLDTLKSYHDRVGTQAAPNAKETAAGKKKLPGKRDQATNAMPRKGAEVVITVRPEESQPAKTK
jgi:hypothetical protein